MTAAAAAATAGSRLNTGAALALVVVGGLVEGLALGWLQARVLGVLAPDVSRRRYVLATVLVAGLGWSAASTPAALATGGDDRQPGLLLVVSAAAALGLVSGAALGVAQALALRGAVGHPWRWVSANVAAWPAPMAVIFVGATTPSDGWPAWAVVVLGAITGGVAGALLGVVAGRFLPSLNGMSSISRVVLSVLASHYGAAARASLVGLQVRGRVSGRWYALPVQYAVTPGGLVIKPGRAEGKTWWRNIDRVPTPVRVLREGVWTQASARVVDQGSPSYAAVRAAFHERWPRATLPADQPMVLVQLGGLRPVV